MIRHAPVDDSFSCGAARTFVALSLEITTSSQLMASADHIVRDTVQDAETGAGLAPVHIIKISPQ